MDKLKITTLLSRHNFFFPLISGILIGTSYIPFPPWAVFFAFIPLWYSLLDENKYRGAFKKALITQFVLTLIGFFWITTVSQEHGHMPFPVALGVLLLFCLLAMYYYPLSALAYVFLNKKFELNKTQKVWLLASLFALFEALAPTLFPWNFGYTWLWANLPGYNLADIFGFQGLSSFSIFINAFLLQAALLCNQRKKAYRWVGAAIALVVGMNLFGYFWGKRLPEPDSSFNVLAVQANVGNLEKEFARSGRNFRTKIIDKFLKLSKAGLKDQNVDFIVWPETAFPATVGPTRNHNYNPQRLFNFVKLNKVPVVTGAYYFNPETEQTSNSIYYINEFGGVDLEPYKKVYLLAFGEYLPGGTWFPWLKKMLPQVADFERGPGPLVTRFKGLVFGNQICYEGLFPSFSRELAEQKAQFFINVTNDSWFGRYSEPYQHLYMTYARAIEFRRPLIRSTNTGITTAILADGTKLEKSPIMKEWQGVFEIKYYKTPVETIFMKWPWLNEIFLVCFLVGLLIVSLRRKNTSSP